MITYVVCLVNPATQQIEHTVTRIGEAIYDEELVEVDGVNYQLHAFEVDEPRMIRGREILDSCVFAQGTIQKQNNDRFPSDLLNVEPRQRGAVTRERLRNGEIGRDGRPINPQP